MDGGAGLHEARPTAQTRNMADLQEISELQGDLKEERRSIISGPEGAPGAAG